MTRVSAEEGRVDTSTQLLEGCKIMEKWRKVLAAILCIVIAASVATAVTVRAEHGTNERDGDNSNEGQGTFEARLNGLHQVPSVISNGTGTFSATLSSDGKSINYTLSYSHLSSTVHFAHIHVGQAFANGGVIVFLCGGGGKPECPAEGTVKGTLTAVDVMAIAGQLTTGGNFNDLIFALRSGVAYVNVHTTNFPAGEIRGQISGGDGADQE